MYENDFDNNYNYICFKLFEYIETVTYFQTKQFSMILQRQLFCPEITFLGCTNR